MYRDTRFGALLKGLSRPTFRQLVRRFEADKHCKGFSSWQHLIAMLYAQLSGAGSLREIETGFNARPLQHYHLGVGAIRRSTLSDANATRTPELFKALCAHLMAQLNDQRQRELQDLLYLLDSTAIPLTGLGYDAWTEGNRTRHIQGLKVHVLISAEHWEVAHLAITPPNVNDIDAGRTLPITPGARYAFDKGYCDYNWWYRLHQAGAFFITRFKSNAGLERLHSRPLSADDVSAGILTDELVGFRHKRPGGGRINHYHGTPLRRITVAREDGRPPLVFATNDLESSAAAIAADYKARWGIELFFKWLKQNLRIKRFLGRSRNAVLIQIYTALIAYLLLALCQRHRGGTLRECLVTLRCALFQRPETDYAVYRRRRRQEREWQKLQAALPL